MGMCLKAVVCPGGAFFFRHMARLVVMGRCVMGVIGVWRAGVMGIGQGAEGPGRG